MSQIREVKFKDTEDMLCFISASSSLSHLQTFSLPLTSSCRLLPIRQGFSSPFPYFIILFASSPLFYIFSSLHSVSLFNTPNFSLALLYPCFPLLCSAPTITLQVPYLTVLSSSCLYSLLSVSLFPSSSISSLFHLAFYSPSLDICGAQQNAAGCMTHNPLVWRLVAVFIIVPNRCLIILRHTHPTPPSHSPPSLFLPVIRPLPSSPLLPPHHSLQIFMDGGKSN